MDKQEMARRRANAIEGLLEQTENAARCFERAAEEMRSQAQRMRELDADIAAGRQTSMGITPADVAGWAAASAAYIRFDLFVKYASEYSKTLVE